MAAGHVEADDLPLGSSASYLATRCLCSDWHALPFIRRHATAGWVKSSLRYVFLLAQTMSEEYGCVGVVVDAKPDAVEFYSRFGFSPLELVEGQKESRPEPTPMFLPLGLIEDALEPRAR